MSDAPLTLYQALLNNDRLAFDKSMAINLATLFLDIDPQEVIHDCLKIQNVIQGSQLDLICQEPSLVG